MSRMTKEINKITGTIIGISGKLILYAVILLLLFEGMTKGYEFGHEIFYATAMDEAPGVDKVVTIPKGQSDAETARMLGQTGLVGNELAFQVQKKFYDYEIYPGTYTLNTSMTSKEILQQLNEKAEEGDGPEQTAAALTGTSEVDGQEAENVLLDMYGGNEEHTEEEMSSEDVSEVEIRLDPEGGEAS